MFSEHFQIFVWRVFDIVCYWNTKCFHQISNLLKSLIAHVLSSFTVLIFAIIFLLMSILGEHQGFKCFSNCLKLLILLFLLAFPIFVLLFLFVFLLFCRLSVSSDVCILLLNLCITFMLLKISSLMTRIQIAILYRRNTN